MKTHFNARNDAPDFNSEITEWVRTTAIDTWGGPPIRVGVIYHFETGKDVYLGITGDSHEMRSVYPFLESLGLVDLAIYNHPRFNCIYGLRGHMPSLHEKWKASCLDRGVTVIENP
jgi:hypothetical protein